MLLVDVGNTALKWQWRDVSGVHHAGREQHRGTDWVERLADAWRALPAPPALWMANVAGARVGGELAAIAGRLWQLEPNTVRTEAAAFGVTNAYPTFRKLGVDRWLTLVGAHVFHPGGAVIVDAGSAVTFDVLTPDGRHRGGAIIPGVGLMQQVLGDTADGIPHSEPAQAATLNELLLSADTPHAVSRGCLYAVAAFIDRAIAQARQDFPGLQHLLLLGGDAARLQPLLATPMEVDQDLVFKGLQVYAQGGTGG